MLYEMLTGEVPFLGSNTQEVIVKHWTAMADLTSIEDPFARVIRRALAKDPAERYQSAQEMVEDVFGAEHVRNSVSQFAPDELSVMADRVFWKKAGGIRTVPSDLVAVAGAAYAPLEGLAVGSPEARERQRQAVQGLGLPLEVKTAKAGIVFRLIHRVVS